MLTWNRGKGGQLTTNFKASEVECKCGKCTPQKIDPALMQLAQAVRNYFGVPVTVNSGYRCAAHNAAVGGASGSQHTLGKALDLVVQGVSVNDVAAYCETLGVPGIIRYDDSGFVHLDTRIGKYWAVHSKSGFATIATFGGVSAAGWIRSLQTAIGVTVDGIAGPKTLAACPTLRSGSKGDSVKALQNRLNALGFSCGTADGIFGAKTVAAVKAFQTAKGLAVDGIVGQNTWKQLLGL